MEAIQIATLADKPDEEELAHQFDYVKNAVVKDQPISLWFLTFMRQGGFNDRGYPTLIVMRDSKHVASFAIAVPPSAYDDFQKPLHVPLLVMFTTPLYAMSATFSSVNADGVTNSYCESMEAIYVHNWQGMFFDDFMMLYDQINAACDIVIFPSLSFSEYTDKVNGLVTFDNFPEVVELNRLADVLNGKKLGWAAAEVHMLQSQLISAIFDSDRNTTVELDSSNGGTTSINDALAVDGDAVGAIGCGVADVAANTAGQQMAVESDTTSINREATVESNAAVTMTLCLGSVHSEISAVTTAVATASPATTVGCDTTSINRDATVKSNDFLLPHELPMLGAVHCDDVTAVQDLIRKEFLDVNGMLSFVPK